MLAKTGLLIVSNPKHVGKLLSHAQSKVKNTVYIQLLSAIGDPFGLFYPNVFNSWPKFSQTIHGIYSQAAKHCRNVDVRVLLSGLKYKELQKIQTQWPVDLVMFDKTYSQDDIDRFLQTRIANKSETCRTITLDDESELDLTDDVTNEKICSHSVLGGTFDRLHVAHKLLLSEAALRSDKKLTVGVTAENMLHTKVLWELIQPLETRINGVKDFLTDICGELQTTVVSITDPFGPTQHDPTMEMIVVSAETFKGGNKVNEVRTSNGLQPLDVVTVQLIDEPYPDVNEESKISSSTTRMRLLGTLLKPIKENKSIPKIPYVIGLTGTIASGKSNVASRLERHGAKIINCDNIAHEVYKAGKPCHTTLVQAFGNTIVAQNGEIDRRVLGGIVFADPTQLELLNSLVWPAMADDVLAIIRNCSNKVVVVEAAILVKAGWDKLCHEVWTTIVPETEAVERLKNRNSLTEEQAKARLHAQAPNTTYVESANIVFCTLWSTEYTYQQVDRAWKELQTRIVS